jgi:FkbM family methyltransferase
MSIAKLAKALLKQCGYDLHRASPACTGSKDAFADQKRLLATCGAKTIFDVGANTGHTAVKYRTLFPLATIFSFEPSAECFEQLRQDFECDQNFYAVCSALSDQPGQREFHLNESSFTNSLLPSVDSSLARKIGTTQVSVTTIDEFCRERGLEAVDLLKLDIQGGELLALQGARSILSQSKISLIYAEVLFATQYEGQAFFFQVYEFLVQFGFVLFDLYDMKHKSNGQLAWCDAIFVGPALADSISTAPFFENKANISK